MEKGYWVAVVDVTDPEGYKDYVAANKAVFAAFGGRFLTRGGQMEVPEGQMRSRVVVIEFPSYQAARDCYHSSEYARCIALRSGKSIMDLSIIEGYGGPQPQD
jgi:uncharacterized protein (DUF1330 family)